MAKLKFNTYYMNIKNKYPNIGLQNLNSHFKQYSLNEEDGDTQVIFQNIKSHLLDFIEEAECIVGCVAWITDTDIIDALKKKKYLSLIVQKDPKYSQNMRADRGRFTTCCWKCAKTKTRGEEILVGQL
ncbi:hypothetical protein GW587_06400 [Duganella sp. SAP-35]|uniref:Uncharacterized protein n=2 Tax=Duganella aceris TaxID=2703883 RepID=A0ABX0FH51_9BURK|nr:hypothetical protein [Duganella aceris]